MLTPAVIAQLAPAVEHPDVWAAALQKTCDTFQINTSNRVRIFLAQVLYESTCLLHLQENLNYSADGLRAMFPTHFSVAEAAAYARQPQRIANRVYANRYGNGNEASGDGWAYRGRGLIQITFKDNYQSAAKMLNLGLSAITGYME